MKFNKQILGCLGASILLLTACTANDDFSQATGEEKKSEVYGKGSNVVTLSLNAEGAVGTRADEVDHISDAGKTDLFIFAVYKKDANGVWQIATEFQKEENRKFNVQGGGSVILGEGQNALRVLRDDYPITLKLALDPDEQYKIACWAQSSLTSAFNTTNLEAVKVNYNTNNLSGVVDGGMMGSTGIALNNDEFRDAFCASKEIQQKGVNEVIMHRPFAQINVGTTGADYHNIMQGRIMLPQKRLLYSKVELTGASKYIDVLADKVLKDKGLKDRGIQDTATEDVVFEYSLIPTYYTLNNIVADAPAYVAYVEELEDLGGLNEEELKAYQEKLAAYKKYLKDRADYESKLLYTPGEEFLRVKLNGDKIEHIVWDLDKVSGEEGGEVPGVGLEGAFFPYKQDYPTLKKYTTDGSMFVTDANGLEEGDNLYLTEEFKYMSMCYVLVPTTTDIEDGKVVYKGSTLDNVTFYFAETQQGNDLTYNGTPYNAGTRLSVKNVPVNRNWRTNILAGLNDVEEPDPDDPTPDGPDDSTSLVKSTKLCIHLCPIFTNETNGFNDWKNGITSWTNYEEGKGFDFSTNFPTDDESWHHYWENLQH